MIGIWRKSRAQNGRVVEALSRRHDQRINGTTDELVVVHVRDAVNPILAGRGDVSYQSPPQPPRTR